MPDDAVTHLAEEIRSCCIETTEIDLIRDHSHLGFDFSISFLSRVRRTIMISLKLSPAADGSAIYIWGGTTLKLCHIDQVERMLRLQPRYIMGRAHKDVRARILTEAKGSLTTSAFKAFEADEFRQALLRSLGRYLQIAHIETLTWVKFLLWVELCARDMNHLDHYTEALHVINNKDKRSLSLMYPKPGTEGAQALELALQPEGGPRSLALVQQHSSGVIDEMVWADVTRYYFGSGGDFPDDTVYMIRVPEWELEALPLLFGALMKCTASYYVIERRLLASVPPGGMLKRFKVSFMTTDGGYLLALNLRATQSVMLRLTKMFKVVTGARAIEMQFNTRDALRVVPVQISSIFSAGVFIPFEICEVISQRVTHATYDITSA
jgi:hypothetical protein